MITLIDVNTCEKLGFDSVIKETYFGLKMQNNFKIFKFWIKYFLVKLSFPNSSST